MASVESSTWNWQRSVDVDGSLRGELRILHSTERIDLCHSFWPPFLLIEDQVSISFFCEVGMLRFILLLVIFSTSALWAQVPPVFRSPRWWK
jgi:hypothetical protein